LIVGCVLSLFPAQTLQGVGGSSRPHCGQFVAAALRGFLQLVNREAEGSHTSVSPTDQTLIRPLSPRQQPERLLLDEGEGRAVVDDGVVVVVSVHHPVVGLRVAVTCN